MAGLSVAIVRGKYTAFGGAERFIEQAVRALHQEGVEVTLLSRAWAQAGATHTKQINPFHIGRTWRDLAFARAVCEEVRHGTYALVQSHERIACCDIYRAGDGVHRGWLEARKALQSPLENLRVALSPYHRYVLKAEQRLFSSPRLRAVICNSQLVREEIQRYFGVGEEKLRVIYNGVDTVKFNPALRAEHREHVRRQLAIAPEAVVYLFVGSGFERKGLDLFIAALAHLPAVAHGVIVGKDKRQARYEQLAHRLGCAQRLRFIGAAQDVRTYYGCADVFVLPTRYDPFPNAVLEALACGLPVITSRHTGAREVISNGVNGWVCDALEANALAAAMEKTLAAEARASLSPAARRTSEAMTFEVMARRLVELYRELLRIPAPETSARV